MTTTNINLELGDIIKLHAPTNDLLNNKTFIISFIDDNSIDLNSSEKETTLTLEDGKLTDESITKISVVFKNELKGFILQNNLTIGTWVDIEFGGDIPLLVTNQITDVIEDMIEVKTYPEGKVFYIDFAYSGVPKEINIKRITIRDEPIKEDEPEVLKTPIDEIEDVEITDESFDYEVTHQEMPEVKIQEAVIEGSKIVFGESMGELIQVVDVDDTIKRFDIDMQINDLLDEMLSNIPKQDRTYKVINEIHTYIERFKQLREEFSEFDSSGNVVEKVLKGVHHKPLADKLKTLSERIPWILPVVLNKKKIYNIEEEDNQFVIPINLQENLLEMDDILKQTTSVEEQYSLFRNILRQTKPYYTPFEQYISDVSITNKETNTFIETIANAENFDFFAVKNDDLNTVKFHLTPYLEKETLNIIGFLVLPKSLIENSMKHLPGLNIAKKSILNKKSILLSNYLSNVSRVKRIEINDTSQEYEYNNFYKTIKYLVSTSEEKDYNKFVDTIIPKIRSLVTMVSKNIKKNEYVVSYNLFLSRLEPFFVYYDDLTFKNFTDLNEIIFHEINKYKIDFINKQKLFEIYGNIRNSEFKKYKLYYSRIYDLLEFYNIRDIKLSNEEFIKHCLEIDNGAYLQSNISNINFKNFTGLNLEPTAIQEKLISLKSTEIDTCDAYVISKKYKSLGELENDNGKDIYFDKDKDPTRYDILESLEINDLEDPESYLEDVKSFLIKNIGLTDKNARRDALSMINNKRKVEEGDLCILEIDEKITYYKRTNNFWVLNPTINESYFKDKTKLLCNTNQLCISSNIDCETKENKQTQHDKQHLNRVITSIEIEQKEKTEDMEEKLINYYKHAKTNLVFRIKERIVGLNSVKLKINDEYILLEKVTSPHLKLLNVILGQKDFSKKQNDILKFERLYTVSGETIYVKNCKDTNTKLFPSFLATLAEAFFSGQYTETLDKICKEQGVISDDGDKWVDKYSGMFIKNIEFSTEEGYSESGFKVVTRDILDNDIDLNVFMDEDQSKFKGDKGIIHNVLLSITNFIGVILTNLEIEELIEIISQTIREKVPDKSVYDKKRASAIKKGAKIPLYETTYNNILLLSTISILFIQLQTAIPSVVAKKSFPGCVRSFSGYPLGDESEISGIKYIACIAHKMRTDSIPWNTIKKTKEETLTKQLQVFIKSIVDNAYIKKKITKKIEYIASNPDVIEELSKTIEWKTFLPELKLTFSGEFLPLTKSFFDAFNKNFKSNNYYFIFYILSKIYYLSLYNQKTIHNSIKPLKPSIVTNIGVPYLENSCGLTRFNEITNWYDIKHNNIACAYREYYDFVVKNTIPNTRINNTNTKLQYNKVANVFSEKIIYETFIFYCSKQKQSDSELSAICKINPDSTANTEEELKRMGVSYNSDDFDRLLQHIFAKNIVRNHIEIAQPFINIKNSELLRFNELYLPLLDISKNNYAKHTKQTDELRNYILDYSDSVKTSLLSLLSGDLSYSKSKIYEVEEFFTSIDKWKLLGKSLTIDSEDLTTKTILTYLKNNIQNIGITFPTMIINSVNNSNIQIRKNLNLSERHIRDIQTFVYSEVQLLEKFYEDTELNKILIEIINVTKEVIKFLNFGPPLLLNLELTHTNVLGKQTMIEIYQFLTCLVINIYIERIYTEESFDSKKRLGDLLFNFIQLLNKNKDTLNMNQEEMYGKLLKYKEVEKSEITTYLRDISDELREIENVMKNQKLGKWSKGQTKGLVTYTAETYDGEIIQQDLRDQDTLGVIDIETSEAMSEFSVANNINEEVDNLAFLADDDDYGERDGDEGF
jgi:hypothetical protein